MLTGKLRKIKAIFVSFPQRQKADIVPDPVPSFSKNWKNWVIYCSGACVRQQKAINWRKTKKANVICSQERDFERLGVKSEVKM